MGLAIQIPPRDGQRAFNLRAWERLLADPELTRIRGRFETDRHGHTVMSPPPSSSHSSRQSRIAILLDKLLGGRALTECPLSTSDGVKSADVAWFSDARYARAFDPRCFLEAGEICVEVISPSNSEAELQEKSALYFDAGAEEVWFCGQDGAMRYSNERGALGQSRLCPAFPAEIEV
jgi:Uma2 family endonuclease